jgi:hypothetical protein
MLMPRLDQNDIILSMHQLTRDLGERNREMGEGTPAPELDELEPEDMAMGDGVSVVSEGGGWKSFPSA